MLEAPTRHEREPNRPYLLLGGNSNLNLSNKIADFLGANITYPVSLFSDNESNTRIQPNIRGRDVVIVQSTSKPHEKNFHDLMSIADAAKKGSAGKITAVIPYFGYARQDRKSRSREPISASLLAEMLELRVDHLITVDLHSEQTTGAFKGPWDLLTAAPVLADVVKSQYQISDFTIVSPDQGGLKRADRFGQILSKSQDFNLASIYKKRLPEIQNESEAVDIMGDVSGTDCIIVDDIIDTGGTLVHAAHLLKTKGAKKVILVATHGVFSGNALDRLSDNAIDRVFITDSIEQPQDVFDSPKFEVVSIAPIIARAIRLNQSGDSLSEDPNLFPQPRMGG